jgi:hypothetical protein
MEDLEESNPDSSSEELRRFPRYYLFKLLRYGAPAPNNLHPCRVFRFHYKPFLNQLPQGVMNFLFLKILSQMLSNQKHRCSFEEEGHIEIHDISSYRQGNLSPQRIVAYDFHILNNKPLSAGGIYFHCNGPFSFGFHMARTSHLSDTAS